MILLTTCFVISVESISSSFIEEGELSLCLRDLNDIKRENQMLRERMKRLEERMEERMEEHVESADAVMLGHKSLLSLSYREDDKMQRSRSLRTLKRTQSKMEIKYPFQKIINKSLEKDPIHTNECVVSHQKRIKHRR